MRMLPFTIKPTDQEVVRLFRLVPSGQHQELNVEVQLLLRSWEIHHLNELRESTRRHLTQQILREVREDAFNAFTAFLRNIAEPQIFLPTELLSRYPYRQYCLLLSSGRASELFEAYNVEGRASQRLIGYEGYELIVNTGVHLQEDEAYLVAPSKYTLFLRQSDTSNAITVFRSDFIDLANNTPPPLDLHAQDIIDTIQNNLQATNTEALESHQLMMFPMPMRPESPPNLTQCPKCGGTVQRVGGERYFCLDCDWDNLLPLR